MHHKAEPRSLALQVVTRVLEHRQDVQEALDIELSQARRRGPMALDPRDAALATELCYGYLRLKTRVDFVIQGFLRKPGAAPPPLLTLLGLAGYGLHYLERVPAYATVDWAVSATAKRFGSSLSRLANAVLRRVSELGPEALQPEYYRRPKESQTTFLSRYWACPEWIVDTWLKAYGPEATGHYLRAQAAPPLLGLRCNQRHAGFQELFASLAGSEACVLTQSPGLALRGGAHVPDLTTLLDQGAVSRQSLASLQALHALELPDSGELWDLCAGHGGKTCALLEATDLRVLASDASLARLKDLRRELARLCLPDIPVFRHRAEAPPPLRRAPRIILVDAPCTGLGVLSRRPDAKWRRSPEDVRKLAAMQQRILKTAARGLAPGGLLAYVTCTLHPAENQEQIGDLLQTHPGLRLEREWSTPPDSQLNEFLFTALLRKT